MAKLHISEGQEQGVVRPSALGDQDAGLNEKNIETHGGTGVLGHRLQPQVVQAGVPATP